MHSHTHTHTALSNRKVFWYYTAWEYTRAYWDQTPQLQWYFRNRIRRCTILNQICNEVLTQIFDAIAVGLHALPKGTDILIHSLNTKATFFLKIFRASLDWGYSLPSKAAGDLCNKCCLTKASYDMANPSLLTISLQMRKNKTRVGGGYPKPCPVNIFKILPPPRPWPETKRQNWKKEKKRGGRTRVMHTKTNHVSRNSPLW